MSKSIKNKIITTITIEKSRFICTLTPILSVEEAIESLELVKSTYHDASHNCFAYVLNNNLVQKCSDDGEPSKTAGYPILQALQNNDLDNVLCVVTRYFGGIKLGTGGLIRAYSASAMESINNSEFSYTFNSYKFDITFDFAFINKIDYYIKINCIDVSNKQFYDKVTYTLNIIEDEFLNVKQNLVNLTKKEILFSNEKKSIISR